MSDALIIEFKGAGPDEYRTVNEALELDPVTGAGDWPDGLLSHTAAGGPDGLLLFEVWASKAAQAAFMSTRLGPALAQAGLPAPVRAEWLTVEGHQARLAL